jgi:hypothetical protein
MMEFQMVNDTEGAADGANAYSITVQGADSGTVHSVMGRSTEERIWGDAHAAAARLVARWGVTEGYGTVLLYRA